MKKLQGVLSAIAFVSLLSGCSNTKEVAYFQDVNNGATIDLIKSSEIKFRPNDKMTIVVNCRDPKLASLYNLPVISQRLGEEKSYSSSSYQMSMYSVDANGDINFPIIGKIHVEGMNRQEVAEAVKSKLSSEIKDASVTVEFANMFVSVLGEVNKRGKFNIVKDRTTIMEVLGEAGDLTIQGLRTNVKVIRTNGDKQEVYTIDLTNAKELASSPAYYLQQNDVVYVEPNLMRKRQNSVNGNNVLSTSFWISVASLLTSVALLFKN